MRMRLRSDWRRSQAGFLVLIEILVVVVIIAALAGYFLMGWGGGGTGHNGQNPNAPATTNTGTNGGGGGGGRPTGPLGDLEAGSSIPGKSLEMAHGVECRNNLSQLRAAIAQAYSTTGAYPADLQSLGVKTTCPVGGEAYVYDPTTGHVSCPHKGHQAY